MVLITSSSSVPITGPEEIVNYLNSSISGRVSTWAVVRVPLNYLSVWVYIATRPNVNKYGSMSCRSICYLVAAFSIAALLMAEKLTAAAGTPPTRSRLAGYVSQLRPRWNIHMRKSDQITPRKYAWWRVPPVCSTFTNETPEMRTSLSIRHRSGVRFSVTLKVEILHWNSSQLFYNFIRIIPHETSKVNVWKRLETFFFNG
jgi:hypothetical protein